MTGKQGPSEAAGAHVWYGYEIGSFQRASFLQWVQLRWWRVRYWCKHRRAHQAALERLAARQRERRQLS
ncbi:hypothetical protein [Micromonospora sp. CB01531]|uniref:hypothetical protein n=1 Tax=Micromonospora sp. CB01531 TaxID=1718947 RepID=UPI000939AA5F|nr:hypothetical protein [Micromonospora sp. CB01531]OKI63395.1 hypothetical protein A6A27_26615 [Micromonospora sp. CB01531]